MAAPSTEPATLLARDRAAREAAQTRFDRPLVLEAGAGTGKTTTLIARLLAWCLGEGWEKAAGEEPAAVRAARVLRRVVALTFTEAAAAEMAADAARELQALGSGAPLPAWLAAARLPAAAETARRARGLVAALDQLTVETIHAWCYRLLLAHPLEAAVHPRLQIDTDGRRLRQVIAETVEGALRPGYGTPGDEHLLALARQGCGPREVAVALAALVDAGMTPEALRRDPFAGPGWPDLRRRIAEAGAGLRDLLGPRLAGGRLPMAADILRGLEALVPAPAAAPAPGREAAPDRAAEVAALRDRCAAALPANLRKRLREWGRCRLTGQERERLGDVAGELAERAAAVARLLSHLDDLDPEKLAHARLALAPLLAAVHEELRRRGIATFDALLTGARHLLATHREVRAGLRRGIDQLLVDEFQDTDETQCEVLAWIALDGPVGERPCLFLVGDPKQSIYGWRNADLRAYDGFVARVVAAGGEVLPLVENFRSVPAVLDEVARVIGPVMHERTGVQPPFTPLVAARHPANAADAAAAARAAAALAGVRAPVEHWVSWLPAAPGPSTAAGAGPSAQELGAAAALEAAAIAADLLGLRRRTGLPWREAAILLRSTGDLDTYLEALRRAGIPFAVGRDKQYFRRREVIDAAALVRAVLDPGDHLALVTLLRSPAVGVPDAALLPLWQHQLPRLLTELHRPDAAALAAVRRAVAAAVAELPAEVPGLDRVAGWDLGLLAAIEQLAVLREAAAVEPADRFIERLRRLPLLDATVAACDLGSYRLANLDRFFRRLASELEQGGGDVAAVLRVLRDDVAAGREAEEARPQAGAEDAVQVLTIHGAKGLDFAHVYLPQLHKPPGGDRPATGAGRLPAGVEDHPDDLGAIEMRLLGASSPGYDLVEQRRVEVAAAERVRTLYVAMTRAKDRLVLAGAWPLRPGDPAPPGQARSHLDLLAWRPGCPDLRWLWGRQLPRDAGAGAELDRDGVLWRFPALAGPRAALVATPAGEPGTPPAALAPVDLVQAELASAELGLAELTAADLGLAELAAAALPPPALAPPAEVAEQAARLAVLRTAAAARMARPFGAAASEEAHARLREEMAAGESPPGAAAAERAPAAAAARPAASGSTDDAGREAAMAAGSAVHRALELWDLAADPAWEAERQGALLPAYLAAVVDPAAAALALPRCRRLLAGFASGDLAARLRRLAGNVLARELPVLLAPPGPADLPPPAAGPDPPGYAGPVAYLSGAIDLLYRDPDDGSLVVADYKTDEVTGADLIRRAASYASQGATYVHAVQEALGLAAPPRFELWFLHAGEVVTAAPGASGPQGPAVPAAPPRRPGVLN